MLPHWHNSESCSCFQSVIQYLCPSQRLPFCLETRQRLYCRVNLATPPQILLLIMQYRNGSFQATKSQHLRLKTHGLQQFFSIYIFRVLLNKRLFQLRCSYGTLCMSERRIAFFTQPLILLLMLFMSEVHWMVLISF